MIPLLSEKVVDKLYENQIVSEPQSTVSYEVEGITYTSKSSISQQPALPFVGEVGVLYDRCQPEQAFIGTFIHCESVFTLIARILIIIGLILMRIVFYIIYLHSVLNKERVAAFL